MLSIFPEILFLAPFSALILRVTLAVIFGIAAWKHVSRPELTLRALSIFEVAVAAALFVGSWTQLAGIGGVILTGLYLAWSPARRYPRSTVILALVMSLSLVVTGAGAFAFDLPL